jgi:WD40 repeat protein
MRRTKRVVGVLVAMALGGCRDNALTPGAQLGGTAGTGGTEGTTVGSQDVPARVAGSAAPTGVGGSAVVGPGAPCERLTLNAPLTLPPAAPGQQYTRCATLGPEAEWQVTLSPSGNRLAAVTGAGTVRLVATDTWTDAQLASPLGQMDAAAFSPDGTTLATLSFEMGQIALWRADDGALLRTFAAPPASGIDTTGGALGFSSDGRRLATSLGTVIDLQTGVSSTWIAGLSPTAVLTLNPESLAFASPAGGSVASIQFTAGDARLLVQTLYQVGNSPDSTRIELRDPTTGEQVKLFDMYTRSLAGFALSPGGRHVAVGKELEARAGGFTPGLSIFDATTGAELAFDATFGATSTDRVLGFSPDGAHLYIRSAGAIRIVATADLSAIGQFDWPADAAFVGVAPTGEIVGSIDGATSWWDPSTGGVVRTVDHPLTAAVWSRDGRFGAGTGDPARLFHFWREADAAPLCAPPADTTTAPALASLGGPGPGENQSVTSADGSVTITNAFVAHTHATNYDALAVTDTTTGSLLRQFGAAYSNAIAISSPSGAQLFTPVGPDVAVWCR